MMYFAYGSLMNRNALTDLCPGARPLEVARVPNHHLAFSGRSDRWGGGTATIALSAGRGLWGALYEIDPACRAEIEGSEGPHGYVWAWTGVEKTNGERVHTGILVKVRDLERTPPSDEYVAVLRDAFEQWGLDGDRLLREAGVE